MVLTIRLRIMMLKFLWQDLEDDEKIGCTALPDTLIDETQLFIGCRCKNLGGLPFEQAIVHVVL